MLNKPTIEIIKLNNTDIVITSDSIFDPSETPIQP